MHFNTLSETLESATLIIQAVKYLEPQLRLAAKAGKEKKEYKLSMISDKTFEKVKNLAEAPIEAVFTDPAYGKVHSILTFAIQHFHNIIFLCECCGMVLLWWLFETGEYYATLC